VDTSTKNNEFLNDALNISANPKSLILFDCKSGSTGISSSSSRSSLQACSSLLMIMI
jgi:hypothetical protein